MDCLDRLEKSYTKEAVEERRKRAAEENEMRIMIEEYKDQEITIKFNNGMEGKIVKISDLDTKKLVNELSDKIINLEADKKYILIKIDEKIKKEKKLIELGKGNFERLYAFEEIKNFINRLEKKNETNNSL